MLNVSDEIKSLYRTDYLPQREKNVHKELFLFFPELDILIENDRIYTESMKLTESLCSEEDLTFGGCEAAQFEITLADVGEEIIGKEMVVVQMLDGAYNMPLGTYVVDSVKKRDDLRFKDIIAYDNMIRFDCDVSAWYNKITFPVTLQNFRQSLCNYIGVGYEQQDLPNDDYMVTKTMTPKTLIGRDVLKVIGEINGMFGHITRENKFKYIDLSGLGLYPSETLYPANDLYPSEPCEVMHNGGYQSIFYEDYYVHKIDGITIRNEEGDIGITVGEKIENPYVIQGNFLVYGKSANELKTIAERILYRVKNKYYVPHTTKMIGLPYLEVGDSVAIIKEHDVVESFIFTRTLTGIQSLRDEISATGNKTRENKVELSTQIEQAEGKIRRITNDIDELSNEMIDNVNGLESKITQTAETFETNLKNAKEGLESQITQTADKFETNLTNTKKNLQSQITQTAEQIVLKVDSNGRLVQVELGDDPELGSYLKLEADNISLEGLTTINGNFRVLLDGSMECEEGTLTNCNFRNGINYIIPEIGKYPLLKFIGNNKFGWGIDSVENVFHGMTNFTDTLKYDGSIVLTYSDLGSSVARYSHSHTTGLTVNASFVSSSVSSGDLIDFDNVSSNNDRAATPTYVKAYVNSQSDIRLKENIEEIEEMEEIYMNLRPVKYQFKEGVTKDNGVVHFGFLAQEIDRLLPHETYAITNIDDEPLDSQKKYCPDGVMHIDDKNFHALHTVMIQKQQTEINALKFQLNELKTLLKQKGVVD